MKQYKSLVATLLLTGMSASSPILVAADDPFCGYVRDSKGEYVVDSNKKCIRTSRWSKEGATKECDPDLFPVEKAPEPEPIAVAEPAKVAYSTVTLSADAFFDFDKSTLKPAGKAKLTELASGLSQYEKVDSIRATGHTDSVGTDRYNQSLSERRAAAVKKFLIEKGVDASVIVTEGLGESSPVASNKTKAGRAKNRRVEVTIGTVEKATK